MAKSSAVEKLSDRVHHLEDELRAVRVEVEELRSMGQTPSERPGHRTLLVPRMTAELRKRLAAETFQALRIEGEPIGAEALQEMSRQLDLEPNELSRDLILMREE
jgi:hypothetical protein